MKSNLLILIFLVTSVFSLAQETMIVGYLPTYRFKTSSEIDFCKVTHLNICFVNPNSNGEIIEVDSLPEMLKIIKEKNPNIKILISLAGGALYDEEEVIWKKFVDNPTYRPILIKNIIKFVEKHNFDGVDVDLEWNNVSRGYSPFVIELKKELHKKNKIITTALPGIKRFKNITDEALNSFDFINIMAYDERGSWAPKNAGHHSSIDFAIRSIKFWRDKHKVPSEKLTLGLPFYGYDFSNTRKTTSFMYKEIVKMNANNINKDSTGLIFYNGIPTIKQKVSIAIENNLAGVMLWELGQDTTKEHSLLSAVHYKVKKMDANDFLSDCDIPKKELIAFKIKKFKQNVLFAVNTAERYFTIESKDIEKIHLKVLNEKGKDKTKRLKFYTKKNIRYYKTKKMKKGVYTLIISMENLSFKKRLTIDKRKKK